MAALIRHVVFFAATTLVHYCMCGHLFWLAEEEEYLNSRSRKIPATPQDMFFEIAAASLEDCRWRCQFERLCVMFSWQPIAGCWLSWSEDYWDQAHFEDNLTSFMRMRYYHSNDFYQECCFSCQPGCQSNSECLNDWQLNRRGYGALHGLCFYGDSNWTRPSGYLGDYKEVCLRDCSGNAQVRWIRMPLVRDFNYEANSYVYVSEPSSDYSTTGAIPPVFLENVSFKIASGNPGPDRGITMCMLVNPRTSQSGNPYVTVFDSAHKVGDDYTYYFGIAGNVMLLAFGDDLVAYIFPEPHEETVDRRISCLALVSIYNLAGISECISTSPYPTRTFEDQLTRVTGISAKAVGALKRRSVYDEKEIHICLTATQIDYYTFNLDIYRNGQKIAHNSSVLAHSMFMLSNSPAISVGRALSLAPAPQATPDQFIGTIRQFVHVHRTYSSEEVYMLYTTLVTCELRVWNQTSCGYTGHDLNDIADIIAGDEYKSENFRLHPSDWGKVSVVGKGCRATFTSTDPLLEYPIHLEEGDYTCAGFQAAMADARFAGAFNFFSSESMVTVDRCDLVMFNGCDSKDLAVPRTTSVRPYNVMDYALTMDQVSLALVGSSCIASMQYSQPFHNVKYNDRLERSISRPFPEGLISCGDFRNGHGILDLGTLSDFQVYRDCAAQIYSGCKPVGRGWHAYEEGNTQNINGNQAVHDMQIADLSSASVVPGCILTARKGSWNTRISGILTECTYPQMPRSTVDTLQLVRCELQVFETCGWRGRSKTFLTASLSWNDEMKDEAPLNFQIRSAVVVGTDCTAELAGGNADKRIVLQQGRHECFEEGLIKVTTNWPKTYTGHLLVHQACTVGVYKRVEDCWNDTGLNGLIKDYGLGFYKRLSPGHLWKAHVQGAGCTMELDNPGHDTSIPSFYGEGTHCFSEADSYETVHIYRCAVKLQKGCGAEEGNTSTVETTTFGMNGLEKIPDHWKDFDSVTVEGTGCEGVMTWSNGERAHFKHGAYNCDRTSNKLSKFTDFPSNIQVLKGCEIKLHDFCFGRGGDVAAFGIGKTNLSDVGFSGRASAITVAGKGCRAILDHTFAFSEGAYDCGEFLAKGVGPNTVMYVSVEKQLPKCAPISKSIADKYHVVLCDA